MIFKDNSNSFIYLLKNIYLNPFIYIVNVCMPYSSLNFNVFCQTKGKMDMCKNMGSKLYQTAIN